MGATGYHLTPLPLPYFHCVMWSTHIYLLVSHWNSAIRVALLHRSAEMVFVAPVVFQILSAIMTILFFNTIRKTGVLITNPYGDDEIDYELDHDLRNLWSESLELIRTIPDVSAAGDVEPKPARRATRRWPRSPRLAASS